MTPPHPHQVGGYVSSTDRALYLARLFEAHGVPSDQLAIDDAQEPHRAHLTHVSVQEGVDADLSPDEFSRYMKLAHALVRDARDDEETRFGPLVKGVNVGYAHADRLMQERPTTPAEAGEMMADPKTIMTEDSDTSETAEEQTDAETPSDRGTAYDEQVVWTGGHTYVIETTAGWFRADLNRKEPKVTQIDLETEEQDAMKVLALTLPSTFDAGERLSMAHVELVAGAMDTVQMAQNIVQSGGAAGAGGASGGAGDDDGELIGDVPGDYDDYDLAELEGEIEDWLERAEEFENDFDAGIIEISTGLVKGSVGFVLDTNPFQSGYHDGDDWQDEKGFDAAKEAWKSITQGKDDSEIKYYGEPDWINFMPAAKVEDVV